MDQSSSRQKASLVINRNFGLLWAAQTISVIGDFAFDTTLVLWIVSTLAHNQPWAPIATSTLYTMALIPTLLIGPLAGVFVDRWDKRRTMISMDLLRALLIGILLLLSGIVPLPFFAGLQLHTFQLVALMIIVLAATVCTQFFTPSRAALIADIVPESEQGRASGLLQTTSSLAMVFGPMLATPVFVAFGVQVALLFNALSFLLSFVLLLTIKVPARVDKTSTKAETTSKQFRFWHEFAEGISFATKNRILTTILITVILSCLGTGAVDTLLIFFLTEHLHASTALYFWLTTGMGAGSIVGAILSSVIIKQVGVARLYWSSLLIAGIFFMAFALSTNVAMAAIFLFLAGMAATPLNVAIMPLIMHVTPRELLGRVMGFLMPIQSGALFISVTLFGTLASTVLLNFHVRLGPLVFDRIDTIFTVSSLLILLAGIYAFISIRNAKVGLSVSQSEEVPTPSTEPMLPGDIVLE